jgi:hypothetical protein
MNPGASTVSMPIASGYTPADSNLYSTTSSVVYRQKEPYPQVGVNPSMSGNATLRMWRKIPHD